MISWLLVFTLTPFAVLFAKLFSSRIAMLIFCAISGYVPFLMEAQVSFLRAFLLLLFWTLWLSVIILWLSYKHPELMGRIIWRSEEYTKSMFRWIDTGRLPEGSNVQVLLFHLRQTLLYCAAALATANFLSLMLGAGLLNYMNYYVASFAGKSFKPSLALVMAWNPWSVIRVVSFLWLGMVVSAPSLSLLFPVAWKFSFPLLLPALAGILFDIGLKIFLSGFWSGKLRPLITGHFD